MTTNIEIIERATMTTDDLIYKPNEVQGGYLEPGEFDHFYKKIIDTPTILRDIRHVEMDSDEMEISKVGFPKRILRPAKEGVALTEEERSKVDLSAIKLTTKEVISEVNITYDVFENVKKKGEDIMEVVTNLLVDRIAIDLEDLIINGDINSPIDDLKVLDGIRKKINSHVINGAGKKMNKRMLNLLVTQVPAKYRKKAQDWMFYMSHQNELGWRDFVSNRQTDLGDSALTGKKLNAFGVSLKGVATLEDYLNNDKQVSDILLVNPKHIILGLNRKLRVEMKKDIQERKYIIVATLKVDVALEEEDATAKIVGLEY